jgi:hypothetical protein
MADTMTAQNTDLSSWDILYIPGLVFSSSRSYALSYISHVSEFYKKCYIQSM